METPVKQGGCCSLGVNITDKRRVELDTCQSEEKFDLKQKKLSHPGIPNLTPIGSRSTIEVRSIHPEVEESWFEWDSPTTATRLREKVAVLVTALTTSRWKRSVLDRAAKTSATAQ
jgi:hypothetical protein